MRGVVLVLLTFVIISSLGFVVANIGNNKEVENKEQNKIFEFNTFTSAVCEDKEGFVHCKDEVFVNCNGEILKANGVAECNGIKLETPKATGSAVFEKDWKDPRN